MRNPVLAMGRQHLPRGSIARGFAAVGLGTALGQGATVLAAPLLARLYDPEAFGLLSVFAAVLSVLVAVASLRYDLAIPIAPDRARAVHLLALSVLLSAVASVLVGLVVTAWGTRIAAGLGAEPLAAWLGLLPIALLVASVVQTLTSWATYQRWFPELGRLRAVQGVGQAVVQVGLGLVRASPLGLIVGDLVGRFLGAGQLAGSALAAVRSTGVSAGALWQSAREHRRFAGVMTAASLLSALSLQIPFLIIPAFFDLDSAGQFFLAYRVLILPATLVSAAVSQVFFGEASLRRADARSLHGLARDVAVSLFAFSIPTYAIVVVAGPALFAVLFGHEWDLAGTYARIVAPSMIVWSVASPISSLPLVGRREHESLAFTAAELVLRATALCIGWIAGSLTVGLVVLSATAVLLNIAAIWRFLRVASVTLADLVRPVARIAALTLPSMVLVVLAHPLGDLAVAAAAIIGWLVAFGLAASRSPEVRHLTEAPG